VDGKPAARRLGHDDIASDRHHASILYFRRILAESRFTPFGIPP